MKKILIVLSFLGLFAVSNKHTMAATEKKVISATQNAILAEVGDTINLDDYEYVHNASMTLALSEVALTSFSDGITISGNQIAVLEKGQHPFLLRYESANIYVYIIAKEKADTEYILFEDDFSGVANGKLPNGYQIIAGSAGIKDEQLLVAGKGGSSMVSLPNYLRGFSNYIIEVDMTIVDQDNDSRWASVMFRYDSENYYQMAMRKDLTLANGVEFAKRINGAWNVTSTTSFSEAFSPSKMLNIKIDVLDSTIKEYMNDTLMITYDQALEFKRGLIGVQATGSNALFDNFKITMPVDYLRSEVFEFTHIPNIYEPLTKIVNPATVLTPLQSLSQLDGYTTKRPATLILTVNSDLEVINSEGVVIDTLYNVLVKLNGKMIPAIRTNDKAVVKSVAEKLKLWGILDVFVISSDKDVILEGRKQYEMIRGILDLSEREFSKESQLDQIRKDTNASQSVAVVINEKSLTKEAVNYLQHRLLTVFTTASSNTNVSQYNAILSGVNGIITSNPEAIFGIYETFTTTTHLREVFIIAHRGLHNGYTSSVGPENSIETALKAVENGAKIIETDVHLTLDQDVVIMHDTTTTRTSSRPFTVSQQYLEMLQDLDLLDVSNTGNTFKVPSFDEYLEALKDKGIVVFVEIKPTDKVLLEKVRDKVIEKNMENQVVVIAFSAQNVGDMKEVMPSMSNGLLTGSLLNSSNLSTSMLNVLTTIVPIKSTLNPAYGQLTPEFIKALTHRGITVWPWTIDDQNNMNYYHTAGVGGITTNVSDYFKDNFLYLEYDQTYIKHEIGKDLIVSGQLMTMSKETYPFRSELIILKNDANATFDASGKLLSVEKKGEVVFYTMTTSTLPNGDIINLYSDQMTIMFVNQSTNILTSPWLYIGLVGVSALSGGIWFILKKGK